MAPWQPVDEPDPFADIEISESASTSDDDTPAHYEYSNKAPRDVADDDEEDDSREETWDAPQVFVSQPLQQQAASPVLGHATLYDKEVDEDADDRHLPSMARSSKRLGDGFDNEAVVDEVESEPKPEHITPRISRKERRRRITEVAGQDQSDAEEAAHTPNRTRGVRSKRKTDSFPETDNGLQADNVDTPSHEASGKKKRRRRRRRKNSVKAEPEVETELQAASDGEADVQTEFRGFSPTPAPPRLSPELQPQSNQEFYDAVELQEETVAVDTLSPQPSAKKRNKKNNKNKHRYVEEEHDGTIEDPNSILFGAEDPLPMQRKSPKKYREVEEQAPDETEGPDGGLIVDTEEPLPKKKKKKTSKSQTKEQTDIAATEVADVDTSAPTADSVAMDLDSPESWRKEKKKRKKSKSVPDGEVTLDDPLDDPIAEDVLEAQAHAEQVILEDKQAIKKARKKRTQDEDVPVSNPAPDGMDVDQDDPQLNGPHQHSTQPADEVMDDIVATKPSRKKKKKRRKSLDGRSEGAENAEDSVPEIVLSELVTDTVQPDDAFAGDDAAESLPKKKKKKSRAQTQSDGDNGDNGGIKSITQVPQRSERDEDGTAEETTSVDAGPELSSQVANSTLRWDRESSPQDDEPEQVAATQNSTMSAELGSPVKKTTHDNVVTSSANVADARVDQTLINDILDQGAKKLKRTKSLKPTKSDHPPNEADDNPIEETALPAATSDPEVGLETQEPVKIGPANKSKRKRGDFTGEGEEQKANKKQRQTVSRSNRGDSVPGVDVDGGVDDTEQREEPVTVGTDISYQDVDMMELDADIDNDPFLDLASTAQRDDPQPQTAHNDVEIEQDELAVRKLNFNASTKKAPPVVSSQPTTIPSSPAIQDETPTRPKRLRNKAKASYNDAGIENEESAWQEKKAKKPGASTVRRRLSLSATPASERHTVSAATHRWMKIKRQVYDGDVTSADFQEEKPTSGEFTDWELARLFETVKNFQEAWSLDEARIVNTIQGPVSSHPSEGDLAGRLWSRLQQQLPHRKLVKIRDVTRKRYHNFVARGQWTDEQDEELRELYKEHAGKWAVLAHLINRHPADVRDRWRNKLAVGPGVVSAEPWTDDEEMTLVKAVMNSMEAINETRRKSSADSFWQQDYYQLVNWASIAETMNPPRGRSQVMGKWNRLNLVFTGKEDLWCQAPNSPFSWALEKARRQLAQMPLQVKEHIIRDIHQQGPASDEKIKWGDVLKSADDRNLKTIWHRGTIELFWQRARRSVKGVVRPKDCTDVLLQRLARHGSFQEYGDMDMSIAVERKIVGDVPIVKAAARRRSMASAEQGSNITFSQLQVLEAGDSSSVAASGRISRGTESPMSVPISTPSAVQAGTSTPTPTGSLVKTKPTPGKRRLSAHAKAAQVSKTRLMTSKMKKQPPTSVQAVRSSPGQDAQIPQPARVTRASGSSSSRKPTKHAESQRDTEADEADKEDSVRPGTRPLTKKSKSRAKQQSTLSAELAADSNSEAGDNEHDDESAAPDKPGDQSKDSTATESTSDSRSTRSALDLHDSDTSHGAVSTTGFLRRAANNTPQVAKGRGSKGLLIKTARSSENSAQEISRRRANSSQRSQDKTVAPRAEKDAAEMPPPSNLRDQMAPKRDPDALFVNGLNTSDEAPDNHTEVSSHVETGDGSMHYIDGVAVYDGLSKSGMDDDVRGAPTRPIRNTPAGETEATAPDEPRRRGRHGSSGTRKARGQDKKAPSTPPWLLARKNKTEANPETEEPNATPPSAQLNSSQRSFEVKPMSKMQTAGPWNSSQQQRSDEDTDNNADASDAELSDLKRMFRLEPGSGRDEASDDEHQHRSPVEEPWDDNLDSGGEEGGMSHVRGTTKTPFQKPVRRRPMEEIEVTQEDGEDMDVDGEVGVQGNEAAESESDDDSVGDIPGY